MPDHEVTLGEVWRLAEANERKLDALPERYVLRREYDIDQRNTDRRFLDFAGDVKEVQLEVEQVQKEQALVEKERQNAAAARRWQLFMLFAGPVATALVTILIFQGQTP